MASTVRAMRSAVPHRCAQRPLLARRTPLAVRALKAGDALPFFELKDDTGKLVKSTELVQDSGAVIFVYPKAGTSGCTVQACGFRDNYEYFAGKGYKIVGMSADLPAEQAKWKAENRFNYPLLSDPAYDALSALGVAKPAKDGVNRSHIIVEKGGKVKDVRISIGSKESVPEAIKAVA